jgi:hypothetical protein
MPTILAGKDGAVVDARKNRAAIGLDEEGMDVLIG